MRKLILAILFLIPLVYALEECMPVVQPALEVPCRITSTWNYTQPCSNHNMTIYAENGSNILNYTFGAFGNSGFCNVTWNITQGGTYNYKTDTGDTGVLTIRVEDEMATLSITFFLVILNLIMFFLPIIKREYTKSPVMDNVIRRGIWIVSLGFLYLNVTVMMQIAENINLAQDQMFLYFVVFGWATVVGEIILMYSTVTSTIQMMQEVRFRKRQGLE